MASYASIADGNLNTNTTWGLVDATSLLDSEAGSQTVTTAYSGTRCTAFTPGAITVSGVAVKLRDRTGTTGTMSVHIALNSTHIEVTGAVATINTADLPVAALAQNEGGWIWFKFASPVALSGATAYEVECVTSSGSMVNLHRDATAGNVSRLLITTANPAGTPAAGSILHVLGAHTSAGAHTTYTVDMDAVSGSITKYGSGTDASLCLSVSRWGTLQYEYAAATNYYLQLDGNLIVYTGGYFTIGTVANPIPRDSTAVLEFDPTADGGMGLLVRNGGTFTAQGLSRTTGKNIVTCKLNTGEAINSTSLGVDTDTGWLDNDVIAIASTTQTATQTEAGAMNGNAAASTLTVDGFAGAGGGLAYAHSGTSPTQAELILLTRNVKIRSTSATVMSYVVFKANGVADIDWVEFYYLGENAADKYGITILSSNVNMAYCSEHDIEDWGLYAAAGSTVTQSVFYKMMTGTVASDVPAIFISSSSFVFTYNVALNCGNNNDNYSSVVKFDNGVFPTFTNNTIAGCNIKVSSFQGGLINIYYSGSGLNTATEAKWSSNVLHSTNGYGIIINTASGYDTRLAGAFGSTTIWRCAATGAQLSPANSVDFVPRLTLKSWVMFGNGTNNIYSIVCNGYLILDSCESSGDTSFATTNGVYTTAPLGKILTSEFINCKFSEAGGIRAVHTTDIAVVITAYSVFRGYATNTLLNGTTEVSGITGSTFTVDSSNFSFFKSTKHDQTAGTHKSWFKYGIIQSDSTYYNTATPSERLTPNSATVYTLESGSFKVNVNSGQTCTPSVYTRKSTVASGGALYNGSQPRLVLKRNDAIGITADTVIDTMTEGATANWEQLTGTTAAAGDDGVMEFVIQCDGTVGFANVDDFTATVA